MKILAFIGRKLLTTWFVGVVLTVAFTLLLTSGGIEGLELQNKNDGYFLLSFLTAIAVGILMLYGMIFSIIIELVTQRWFQEAWMYVFLHVVFGLVFVLLGSGFNMLLLGTALVVTLLYVGVDRAIFTWADRATRWILFAVTPVLLYILGFGLFRLMV
ncbi:hypothetical protein JNUCC1_02771 [Lentibacillus sp. JNUCC-1]|uniref:hypothetical protein n=1 Tax=Lentibacillus sp. JNUCC-1 TaxID=2654513 RepID=UPI0012E7BE1D|nr:hypothetical protein [Lentibacillus sp. JNUCC-1]MUV38899.1 hypothetical protein [Lentibacillus sp. JNUCC-1]